MSEIVVQKLAVAEQKRLTELESVIEQGKQTFIDVGMALVAIREEKLYRPLTFEAYCKERWDFTDQRARQLMSAAKTATRVAVDVVELHSEGHLRALNRIPEHAQSEIAPLIADKTVREAEEIVREYRERNGVGNIHNRHPRLVALAEDLGGLEGRWKEEMCNDLTPPQARKQLRTIEKAMVVLEQARVAVEYRAATMHSWGGR